MAKIGSFHNGSVTFRNGAVTLRIVQLAHAAGECILRRGEVATHYSQINLERTYLFSDQRLLTLLTF